MTRRRTTRHPAPALATALAALAALASCSGGPDGSSGAGGPGSPAVIAPGAPGEAAETLSAEEARRAGEAQRPGPNAADFAYVVRMIEHHRQALVMTGLAEKHAASDRVARLAERIAAAQEPEIEAMRAWLRSNGGTDGSGRGGHGGGRMPGMATEAQLEELRAARGGGFDRLFLELMIAHHEGAVSMAREVAAQGRDTMVGEMAGDVAAQQRAEIDRMRALL